MISKTSFVALIGFALLGVALAGTQVSIEEMCQKGTQHCRTDGFTDQEITQFKQEKFNIFNTCLDAQKIKKLDQTNINGADQANMTDPDDDSEEDNYCIEDPFNTWYSLIQTEESLVLEAVRCCYAIENGMITDKKAIITKHFEAIAEESLSEEILSTFLSGIAACAPLKKDCMISSFLTCVVSKCIDEYEE